MMMLVLFMSDRRLLIYGCICVSDSQHDVVRMDNAYRMVRIYSTSSVC